MGLPAAPAFLTLGKQLGPRTVGEALSLRDAVVPGGRGRVARPFGSALTDPGMRLSRTRLLPEVNPHCTARGVQG